MLPWYFHPVDHDEFQGLHLRTDFASSEFLIHAPIDVQRLRKRLDLGVLSDKPMIRLDPEPELIRSTDLINEVAELALELDLTVRLEGSILSHVFYLLQRAGVKCQAEASAELSEPHPRRFNKLVRDRIPDLIRSNWESLVKSE